MSIEIKELKHVYNSGTSFESIALDSVNLSVNDHTFTALIGHTGSGKSTLIQHLNGLLLPTQGTVYINDFILNNQKNKHIKDLRKKVGMVFQFPEYQLFEDTVLKDIIFGPKNFGVDESTSINLAKQYIKKVGLDESYLDKSPLDLSGGEKRRVAIAGILVMQPEILVVDEPTAGLDPRGAKEILELFKDLYLSGTTIIMVTHNMNHVLKYCDSVILMHQSHLITHCDVCDFFNNDEIIQQYQIELPLITALIKELNQKGFNINPKIRNIQSLSDAIGGQL